MFGLRLQKLATRPGRQAPYRLEFRPSARRHRISTSVVVSWLGTSIAPLARVCDSSWQHERSAILGRKFPSWASPFGARARTSRRCVVCHGRSRVGRMLAVVRAVGMAQHVQAVLPAEPRAIARRSLFLPLDTAHPRFVRAKASRRIFRRNIRRVGNADHDWQAEYAGWPALVKVKYVERAIHEIGIATAAADASEQFIASSVYARIDLRVSRSARYRS